MVVHISLLVEVNSLTRYGAFISMYVNVKRRVKRNFICVLSHGQFMHSCNNVVRDHDEQKPSAVKMLLHVGRFGEIVDLCEQPSLTIA